MKIINATVAGGGGMNAQAVLVTRMQGRNPPDSFQVHAGHELIDTWVVASRMEPITFIFQERGYLAAYPRGLVDIISWKGEIYSAPVNIHRSNMLWYNKRIFAGHGLRAPSSIEELLAVCRKLSGAGITPLALGDNGIWAATHLFESVALAVLGSEGYRGLWDGSTPWDSPAARQAIARFIGLLDYVNSDHAALSWDGAAQYVADGKAAMTVMGDWVEGYFKAKGLTPGRAVRLGRLARHRRQLPHAFGFLRPAQGGPAPRPGHRLGGPLRLPGGPGRLQPEEGLHPRAHGRRPAPVRRLPALGHGGLRRQPHRAQRGPRGRGLTGLGQPGQPGHVHPDHREEPG